MPEHCLEAHLDLFHTRDRGCIGQRHHLARLPIETIWLLPCSSERHLYPWHTSHRGNIGHAHLLSRQEVATLSVQLRSRPSRTHDSPNRNLPPMARRSTGARSPQNSTESELTSV